MILEQVVVLFPIVELIDGVLDTEGRACMHMWFHSQYAKCQNRLDWWGYVRVTGVPVK